MFAAELLPFFRKMSLGMRERTGLGFDDSARQDIVPAPRVSSSVSNLGGAEIYGTDLKYELAT
jgi:hypothetical protein